MQYYDLKKNWRKVRVVINDPAVQKVLARDLNRFTWGRWRKKFQVGMLPADFESCDWRISKRLDGMRGREPSFWSYVKHSACHWLCNFNLEVARRVLPNRSWRVVTSDKHSTVWDSDKTLLDFNFQAFDISPDECFSLAFDTGFVLVPGMHYKTHLAHHWRRDLPKRRAR